MALDTYNKTNWTPKMPITADRMNKVEDGIYDNREAIKTLDTASSNAASAITELQGTVAGYNSINTIANALNDRPTMSLVQNYVAQEVSGFSGAATELANARIDNDMITHDSLQARLNAMTTFMKDIKSSLGTKIVNGEVVDAYSSINTVYNAVNNLSLDVGAAHTNGINNQSYQSLQEHLTAIHSEINGISTNVNILINSTGQDGEGHAIPLTTKIAQLDSLIAEVSAAHRNDLVDSNNNPITDSLLLRFTEDETAISGKIDKSVIENNLTTIDTTVGHVLDARQGRILKELLYKPADTAFTTTDTVASRIQNVATRVGTIESAMGDLAQAGFDDTHPIADTIAEIDDAHRDVNDTLDNRFDDIETELTNAHTSSIIKEDDNGTLVDKVYGSLDARLEAIETHKKSLADEIDAAHTSSIITDSHEEEVGGETVTTQVPHTYDSLDARLEAIESHAAAVRTDVNAIAGELAMVDHESIVTTNTRVDTLENYLRTMAAELDMLDGTAIVDTNTRIDGIEDEITDAHRQSGDTLDNRFDDIESLISHAAEGNDPGGLTEQLADLKDAIEDETTGLDATRTTANNAWNETIRLDGRIDNISSSVGTPTVIIGEDRISYNQETGLPTIYTNSNKTVVDNTISEDKDYLLQKGDKYYYWKYIKVSTSPDVFAWKLISGDSEGSGNGGGNTSGYDLTREEYDELEEYSENTDYYVTEDNGLIRHYRYVTISNELTEIEIGPLTTNIKKYNISSGVETRRVDGVDTDVTCLYLHEFAYGADSSEPTQATIITTIPLPSGGGGTISAQKIVRITERNVVQPLGAVTPVELKFFYTSGVAKESGIGELYMEDVLIQENILITSGDPADASSTWPSVTPLPDGFYSIDVSSYCNELGIKQFRIKISDPDDETGTLWKDLKWDVNVMNLTLTSNFTEHSINALNSTVKFTYIANGDIDKVANFKLGDTVLPTVSLSRNTSGQQQEYNITMPQAGAGAYRLEAWLTATANGHALPPSQSIYRDIIWYDTSSSELIMSSPYRNNVEEPVSQYSTLEIPYTIVGGTAPYTVYYYVDDMSEPINEVTLTSSAGIWEYKANNDGIHNLKIACGTATITFSINVRKINYDLSPETDNLVLDFNPQGVTNTSNKRLWTNGTYSMTVSNNFDWYNGGYGSDESGDYFLIKAGTRATFDYKMFKLTEVNNSLVNEVFETGQEFKIIFKTSAVRNADAVWLSNMGASGSSANAKQVGIQLNAHNGFLKTNAASETAVGSGDDEVAATNTYLYFSYSEEDKIELDININQKSETSQFIMSYEDGCPSKAYPYKTSEILYHIQDETHTPSDITIGSDDCDVYVYRMRIYNTELNTEQVLRNFIADGKDSNESIARYERNCIYYDTDKKEFTPYVNANTILDPERLATKIPDVKVLMLETPQFTKSKKDFIPYSSLRCIHAPGGKVFPSRGKEDNWLFQNGYHAGQGTTSDKYGNAARNLDFLFMCDGIHNPSDKVSVKNENFLPGYQSSLILGYGTEEQQDPMYCLDWKDGDTWTANKAYAQDDLVRYNHEVYKCTIAHTSSSTFESNNWALQEGYTSKVTLTSTSIPNNFFNLKVNIASSENANNALLQKRYNDFLPYISPAKLRDTRIKNDMEFVPAVIFIKETGQATVNGETVTYTRRAFNDSEWHFYALGNIGDSKKTDYTRAYDPDDMNEFTLEISDNNTNNSQFQSGVYNASFYRLVNSPVVANINDYYELTDGGIYGTVTYNSETQYYGNFIKTIDSAINNEKNYYEFIEKRRFIEPYTVEQDKEDDGTLKDTYTARSAAGEAVQTTEYLFPIDYETEWAALDGNNQPINMRYWSLTKEKFDGDHSFEMRYACQGNYRDGKLVNDTHGKITVNGEQVSKDKYQVDTINTNVWRAFYTWLVTATQEQFVAEIDEWCVRSSVEFFYAFTHYYTMMDNRAKNTFWHFAKTGKHRRVSRPVEALYHVYEVADGEVTEDAQNAGVYNGTFVAPSEPFDVNATYYTQYAFDMWVYDTDTALGIDNNGELVFPYGKEDKDYRIDGDPSSSYVFNGAGSIFFCRLRDNFGTDIRNIFTSVRTECFNAENLIEEFDKYQGCYPEAIWRLDVERKYIRSFTGDTENGVSITNKETRFLRDMMQGRKKYQRRQWTKDQDIYFGSKYMLPVINGDFFEFSCYTPGGQAVTPNWDLTITPYQDMYINVSHAETNASPIRAKAGIRYEVKCPFSTMNDSRIRVYGANHIQALEGKPIRNNNDEIIGADGLASFYIKANNFENGKKLRKLILGTDNTSYSNGNFTTLNIANDYPILEEFNIKNCNNLGGQLDFSKSTALRRIEAQGTKITQVLLPNSTGVQVLHLPETITKIELKSAMQLNELTIKDRSGVDNLSNITQLDINNSDYSANINWMTIARVVLNHLDLLSLLNLNTSSINDINELEDFKSRKDVIGRVYLGGILHVLGSYSTLEKETYESIWSANDLRLDVTQGTIQTKHKVTYVKEGAIADAHGNYADEDVYKILFINDGTAAPDIYSTGAIAIPTKASTPEFDFVFGANDEISGDYIAYSGWKLSTGTTALTTAPIIHDTTVIVANFTRVRRQYYVRWYSEPNKLVKTANRAVYYGEGYNLENPTIKDIHAAGYETCTVSKNNGLITYSIFKGWDKLPININPDGSTRYFDIYGQWETGTAALGDLFDDVSNLDEIQLLALSTLTDSEKETYGINNKIDISTTMTYKLGADNTASQYNGHVIVSDVSQPVYLSGSTNTIGTSYQPLLANSDAFTFAIDYALNDTTYETGKNYAIIASCYHSADNVRNGFGIFKNISTGKIEVGFGDMYRYADQRVSVSTAAQSTMRNIIVLRHPKNSPTLYIYSGLRDATSIPLEEAQYQYITRREEAEFNSNAYLNIGQLISDQETIPNDDSIRTTWTKAVGTIYWAKYWEEDLGIGECKRIAAWPHEQLTLALAYSYKDPNAGMNTIRAQENVVPTPTLQLATCTNLTHGVLVQDRKNYSSFVNNFYGWKDCDARTLCNNRLLFSLPIKLQSILLKSQVPTLSVEYYDDSQAGYVYRLNNYTTLTRDYLYAYSITNVTTVANSNYSLEDPNNNPFGWRVATNVRIHTYNASNEIWSVSNSDNDGRGQFMNLRFPYKSFIGHGVIDVYRQEYDPGSYNIVQSIGASVIKSGDIYVEGDQAYIYISNREINTYGLSNYIVRGDAKFTGIADNAAENIGGGAGLGGWIRSEDYWTRSLITNGSQYTTFSEVRTDGGVNTSSIATSNPGFKVNYILAI